MKVLALIFIFASAIVNAESSQPNCSGIESWPTSIAYAQLKNEKLVTPETIDYEKTKTIRLASEKISHDLYKQIHHVIFTLKNGKIIQVITSNEASSDECSMSGVDIYVISKIL